MPLMTPAQVPVKLTLVSKRARFWEQQINTDFGYVFKTAYCTKVLRGSIVAALQPVLATYKVCTHLYEFKDESKDIFYFLVKHPNV